jgi:subtilisin family serine protease
MGAAPGDGEGASVPSATDDVVEAKAPRWNDAATRCVRAAGLIGLCASSRGARNTIIALIDGVVERSHASLRDSLVEVIDRTRTAGQASREHATFIASIFTGAGPACLGLARECPILDIGVVDDAMLDGFNRPREDATRLASAIGLASARGARIIQISLDLAFVGTEARALCAAAAAAVSRGAVIVVAAGQRQFAPVSPLLFVPGVIPVSGTTRDGYPLHSVYRSTALNVGGVLAPAIDIPGAVLPTGTALRSGTSFAACFVTGAIALACSVAPEMTPRDAAALLTRRLASRHGALPVPLDADACFGSFASLRRTVNDC